MFKKTLFTVLSMLLATSVWAATAEANHWMYMGQNQAAPDAATGQANPAIPQAIPGNAVFNPTTPAGWEIMLNPTAYPMFMNPATYGQFMSPQFFMQFADPNLMATWMNPGSYQTFMNPAAHTKMMNPASYQAFMNPVTYQAWMNPAAYSTFMNPSTYMQWMQQSQAFAQSQGGLNPFDPSSWAAAPQTEDQAAATTEGEKPAEGVEQTQ